MKCQVENCEKESVIELTIGYTDGKKVTCNYCNEHGKPIFQKEFREMYGLSPIESKKKETKQ